MLFQATRSSVCTTRFNAQSYDRLAALVDPVALIGGLAGVHRKGRTTFNQRTL